MREDMISKEQVKANVEDYMEMVTWRLNMSVGLLSAFMGIVLLSTQDIHILLSLNDTYNSVNVVYISIGMGTLTGGLLLISLGLYRYSIHNSKKANNAVEKLDEIGHGIYIAELSAWESLVSRVGVTPTLAAVIDEASVAIGLSIVALTGGTIQILGLILALAGAIGIIRRKAA